MQHLEDFGMNISFKIVIKEDYPIILDIMDHQKGTTPTKIPINVRRKQMEDLPMSENRKLSPIFYAQADMLLIQTI